MPNLVLLVEPLSPRELEVLEELSNEGQSNAAIGVELFISEKTVRTHLHHVMAKLGANTRTQAVIQAHRLGLIGSQDAWPPMAQAMLALIFAYPAEFAMLVEAGAIDNLSDSVEV